MKENTILLKKENTALLEKVEYLTEELTNNREQTETLINLLERRDARISRMQRRIDELLKRIYGRRSEKMDPGQLLMNDVLLEAEKTNIESPERSETLTDQKEIMVSAHKRVRRKKLEAPEHWERVDHELDIDEKDKTCACCGERMSRIGEDITERLDYQPVQMKVNRYIRPKYACKNAECTEGRIKQAEAPCGPIGRCEAESSLLAHIIVEKFEHHIPLYRQEVRFERLGLALGRMTMSGWMAKCAYTLKPLYELVRETILSGDIVLNDDTPVDMLEPGRGKTRTARLWCSVGGEDLKYIMYNFTRTRGREGPEDFFRDYKGYLVADAYGGYDPLFKKGEITHIGCWTHARRYFIKAQDSEPGLSTEILMLIARLEEQQAKVLPRSPQGEAIRYTLGQWETLTRYTTEGRLPIDNNLAEQNIRPVALGRKNWLFVGSENGGHTAAVLMSFCVMCRKLKINTWEYLTDVLNRINDHKMTRLAELLPDNWQRLRNKL